MTTIFASDFHGTGNQYINKIQRMYHKYPSAQIVFGGDYIDGRKYSKQVLNYVRQMQNNHHAIVLKGNHEDLMQTFIETGIDKYGWYQNGAKTTIKSLFGRGFSKRQTCYLLNTYRLYDGTPLRQYIANLPTEYVNDDGCFVHAYVDVGAPDIQSAIDNTSDLDRMWNRSLAEDIDYHQNKTGKAVIFGHTPTCFIKQKPKIDPTGQQIINYLSPIIDKQIDKCPIVTSTFHHPGEKLLIACDGGCHRQGSYNTGNVVVIKNGEIIDYEN